MSILSHNISARDAEHQKLAADVADWIARNGAPKLYPPDVSGEVAHRRERGVNHQRVPERRRCRACQASRPDAARVVPTCWDSWGSEGGVTAYIESTGLA